MREHTFWPSWTPKKKSYGFLAAMFLVAGIAQFGHGVLSTPPARSALTTVTGKLENIYRLPRGRLTDARIDVTVSTPDGRRTTAKIIDKGIFHDQLASLKNKKIVLKINRSHWVFALSSGDREIVNYDETRARWIDDNRNSVSVGGTMGIFGLLIGLGWLLQRRRLSGEPQAG